MHHDLTHGCPPLSHVRACRSQLAISIFAFKKTQTLLDGWLVLGLYPVSLILVIVLEHFGID